MAEATGRSASASFLDRIGGAITGRIVKEIEGGTEKVAQRKEQAKPDRRYLVTDGTEKSVEAGRANSDGWEKYTKNPLLVGSVALLLVAVGIKVLK